MWVNEEQLTSQGESIHFDCRMLFKAFNAMRRERSAPRRSDLDLGRLRRLLSSLFIAEQDLPSGDFRWRLAGTQVSALLGGEATGRMVGEAWSGADGSKLRGFLSAVSTSHRPDLLRMRFRTDQGQWIKAELAAVPLMAADGVTTQVLGGIFTLADAGLRHHDAITGREILLARTQQQAEAPASPRFRVITGGRT
jgi:hypothetical protein